MTGQADFSYLRGSIRGVIIHEACAYGEGGGGSEFSDCREVNSHLRDF